MKNCAFRRSAAIGIIVALLFTKLAIAASNEAVTPGVLRLKVGEIDTALHENLLNSATLATAPGERLILQMDGPLTPQRREALRATGVQLGEYLPDFAYIAEAQGVDRDALRGLGFVRWLGRFETAWRIDPELGVRPLTSETRIALRAAGFAQVVVVLFAGRDSSAATAGIVDGGGTVLGEYPVGSQRMIDAVISLDGARALASLPTVQFVEEAPEGSHRNDSNRWIAQSNVFAQTPIWDRGLHGANAVVGIIDTTVAESHCMFDDSLPPGDPAHRKIVGWRNASALGPHGTHVAGTLAGDAPPYGEYTTHDGLAFAAKLSFSNSNHVFANPATLYQRLLDAHTDGARVHSNSWGDDGTRSYTTWCRQIDQYSYDFEDGLVAFAVSNGPVVTTPENATSTLGVAASRDAPDQDLHWDGGTGPTVDGRRKPEVLSPGHATLSASAFGSCDVITNSGTSMACPVVSAGAVLARQYFLEGYYPSGAARTIDSLAPSGALLRAVLVNSAVDMTGIAGYPGDLEGWGRLLLDDGLYFAGDAAGLLIEDVRNAEGLATGQTATFAFDVRSAAPPLRITMAFTQPPAAVNAINPVINNLDLEVLAPDGSLYLGNDFAGGESNTGGAADPRNHVERVVRNSPLVGTYTVTVRATAVNAGEGVGLQGYALAITGDVATGCNPPVNGDLDGNCHVDLADLTAFLASFGQCAGEPGFNDAADFDANGCVSLGDLTVLLSNFGA